MAVFKPVVANKIEDLDQALKNNESVILINNKHLFKKVKEKCDEDVRIKEMIKKDAKKGVGAAAAVPVTFVTALLGSVLWEGLIVVGSVAIVGEMLYGVFKGGSSLLKSLWAAIYSELGNYKWFDDGKGKFIVLYKYKGNNKFDPMKDSISYENGKIVCK